MKKRIAIFSVVIIGIVTTVFVIIIRRNNSIESAREKIKHNTTNQSKRRVLYPLPTAKFASYATESSPSSNLVENLQRRFFQASFDASYIDALAKKLGFAQPKMTDAGLFTMVTELGKRQVLNFDTKTGGFFFYTAEPVETSNSKTGNLVGISEQFIETVDMQDGTIGCTTDYRRASVPHATFVECHRLWEKMGLPLLDVYSILNLSENERLTSLSLGLIDETTAKDPDIIAASDGKAGFQRPNGFNTITLAIDDTTHGVTSVASSIRPFREATEGEASNIQQIKRPEEALDDLKKNKIILTLTKPRGTGVLDLEKVYPDNEVVADSVTVTDTLLAYAENPPDQKQAVLDPVYIFKGYGTTKSGYDIDFVQTVPATYSDTTVLGATAFNSSGFEKASTIQYSTLLFGSSATPTPVPTLTPTPTILIPTIPPPTIPPVTPIPTVVPSPTTIPPRQPTPSQQRAATCPQFDRIYQMPNGARLALSSHDLVDEGYGAYYRYMYYLPGANEDFDFETLLAESAQGRYPNGGSDQYLQEARRAKEAVDKGEMDPQILADLISTMVEIRIANILFPIGLDRGVLLQFCLPQALPTCSFTPQTSQDTPRACVRVASVSPTIFIYGKEGQIVTMYPTNSGVITYTNPPFNTHDGWIVPLSTQNIPKLYYEYDPSIIRSHLGSTKPNFIIAKKDIITYLQNKVFDNLDLNEREREAFSVEIQREVRSIKSDSLAISLLDNLLLTTYLPLDSTPKMPLYRVNLFIRPQRPGDVVVPAVYPHITRSGTYAVETGVVVE